MNRCIRVLQTHALPLGYCAMIKKYSIDLSKFWHITEWGSSGVADRPVPYHLATAPWYEHLATVFWSLTCDPCRRRSRGFFELTRRRVRTLMYYNKCISARQAFRPDFLRIFSDPTAFLSRLISHLKLKRRFFLKIPVHHLPG